jgi:transposase InsO family protein
MLAANGVAISMDRKGAWRDNVFAERLWRSVKYEDVYLRAYHSVAEARASSSAAIWISTTASARIGAWAPEPGPGVFPPPTPGHGGLNFRRRGWRVTPVGLRPPCLTRQPWPVQAIPATAERR